MSESGRKRTRVEIEEDDLTDRQQIMGTLIFGAVALVGAGIYSAVSQYFSSTQNTEESEFVPEEISDDLIALITDEDDRHAEEGTPSAPEMRDCYESDDAALAAYYTYVV